MTKMKALWLRIPRKQRIALNLLAILLLSFAVYIFCGCPAFTARQKFRRAERANLVGPSDILGIWELEVPGFNHLVVAEDDESVSMYTFYNLIDSSGNFVYRKKTGALTVLAIPDWHDLDTSREGTEFPVFLFDDYPEAVRAELTFTLSETLNNVYSEKDYLLEAAREGDGFFRFLLPVSSNSVERCAVQEFSRLCGYSGSPNLATQTVTVRLYDEADTLLLEEDVIIRCVADEAHQR